MAMQPWRYKEKYFGWTHTTHIIINDARTTFTLNTLLLIFSAETNTELAAKKDHRQETSRKYMFTYLL